MAIDHSRRGFLMALGAAGLLTAACSSGKPAADRADREAVTLAHAFGETTIPAPPRRVVSAGFTEQDSLLAVGVVPIAITGWWGDEPYAVWPWARSALGDARPTVLTLDQGIQLDRIAALTPDLIVAVNAGCDADTYQKLSAIAPTLPQSGPVPFFEPWKDQATAIGKAVFQADAMAGLIRKVDDGFAAVAAANPGFQNKKVLLLQGTLWDNTIVATRSGWRTEFLTAMGFTIADGIDDFGREHDNRAYLPLDRAADVLDAADLLIWTTENDEDQAGLLANPAVSGLAAMKERRYVFTDKELAGAIAFSSVLSYPVVTERLPPLLATSLA